MKFTGERFIPEGDHLVDEIGYEHLHRYYAAASLVKGLHVLDIACGEGYGSVILAENASRVTGIDIDEESIRCANEKYKQKISNLSFTQGSAASIPEPDQSYDMVISFETIEHLDETMQHSFMTEIKRVLRPGGILLMSTPDKKNYTDRYDHKNPFHLKEFYREEFYSFINKYFNHSTFFEQGYEIASIISNGDTEKEKIIQLHKWNYSNQIQRKYIIAVASEDNLPKEVANLSSIVPEVDKKFSVLIDRLITMNTEIENLGQWGKTSSASLEIAEEKIHAQEKSMTEHERIDSQYLQLLKEKENIILKQSLTIKSLSDHKLELFATSNRSSQQFNEIQQLNQQLQKKLQEKELLLTELQSQLHQLYQESNIAKERLSEIYASDGWKLLSPYYKLKGKFLPENSERYKKLKKIFNRLRLKKGATSQLLSDQNNQSKFTSEDLPQTFEQLKIPAFEHPLVSIIIPAYNAWAINYQCIKSIIENSAGIAYEVILADDLSTDETRDCTNKIENIVHIRNEQNLGFLKNCNHAAAYVKGEYLLFLNNDTKVKPNWLSPLVNLMESDETIGMAGSKLIYPDGRLQEAGGIIWNDASGWNYGHSQDPQLPQFNYVKEVDYVSGASIIIRKKAWHEAGGFDERYSPAYCEDSDFAFTLRSIGYKVMYQPLSEVIHYEGYSHGTDTTLQQNGESVKAYQQINNKKFFEKWQDVLSSEQFANGQNVFQARDRTSKRKTILVIDHYVPHFDKDAGSKTTFQYLELFRSLNLNVKFIGDNFFRHEPYTTALEQMGIEVLYGPWYRDNWQQWIKDNSQYIDYIYINRPHISIKYIDFIKQHTTALILYYGHDLHFLREEKQYEVEKDPGILKSSQQWKKTESYLFDKSDIVLTPSLEEKSLIQSMNKAYQVETILPYFYKKMASPVSNFANRADLIFVGGFGHTPNLGAAIWFCKEVWPLVSQALPEIKFIIVGSNPPDEIKALQSDRIDVKGFISEKTLIDLYNKVKIAVIPLQYGAGVKGKTIEAMYNGLPIVSTDFGIEGLPGNYTDFLKPFNQPKDFANEIIRLYNDEISLKELSTAETTYINNYFTQESASAQMRHMLNIGNHF